MINNHKKIIGERIKEIRLSKGMTLRSFGKSVGVTKDAVSKWEKGRSLPLPLRLKIIAELGDITVDKLLSEE